MQILLISATQAEIDPTLDFLKKNSIRQSISTFYFKSFSVSPFISGVGSPMTAFALAQLNMQNIQFVIHAGLSGSLDTEVKLASLFQVTKEKWSDLGAKDQQGNLIDLHDLGFLDSNQFPFEDKWIVNHSNFAINLPKAYGITSNCASGILSEIQKLKEKYPFALESMEGAAVFYACRMKDVKFVSIRAVSNHVLPRDKKLWKLSESIENLNEFLVGLLNEWIKDQRNFISSN
ncbi:MAG: hypothetical protein IPM48_11635 [Saprospiraceae bacterium]|nr:hypothetical protein [Saprospiraceae bacterium]